MSGSTFILNPNPHTEFSSNPHSYPFILLLLLLCIQVWSVLLIPFDRNMFSKY